MNYPQPPYGQQPQQGYPEQQQAYAPPPQAPQYQQPGYPSQGPPPQQPQYQPQYGNPYPQQPPPGYQPQYGNPYPQQPPPGPQPEVRRGDLKAFMDQPAGADGKSLAFDHPGDRYVGTVIRNVTDADVDFQTNPSTGEIARYTDGREKYVMKVPMLITPSAMYPEGIGVFYVNGTTRNELRRAQEAAGVEPGPPRAGDVIDVTFTHEQQGKRGQNPRKVKRIVYQGGNGEAPQIPVPGQTPAYAQSVQMAQQAGPGWGATPGVQYAQPPQQPQYQQPAQMQMQAGPFPSQGTATQFPPPQQFSMPDPAHAYQQATGQPMPPPPGAPTGQYAQPSGAPAPGPTYGYGQPNADWNPYAQQQVPPTGGAPGAQPQQTAVPTGPAAPSNQPPPGLTENPVPGSLTEAQARLAAVMNLPQVTGQQQQRNDPGAAVVASAAPGSLPW